MRALALSRPHPPPGARKYVHPVRTATLARTRTRVYTHTHRHKYTASRAERRCSLRWCSSSSSSSSSTERHIQDEVYNNDDDSRVVDGCHFWVIGCVFVGLNVPSGRRSSPCRPGRTCLSSRAHLLSHGRGRRAGANMAGTAGGGRAASLSLSLSA